MANITRVKLFVKELEKAYQVEKIVKQELEKNSIVIDNSDYEVAISIGGDGTFIKMIHKNNFNDKLLYAGINAGSLGFLVSCDISNVDKFIKSLKNEFKVIELPLLKTTVVTSTSKNEYFAINETTIRKSDFSTMKHNILINDQLFEKFVGDGLIISTSTGSTAYNMSFNGPIIDTSLNTINITPIAPINNKVYKSISNTFVFSNSKKITLIPNSNTSICIINDGKIDNLNDVKEINISIIPNKIKCIVPNDYDYIKLIKSKIIDIGE